MRYYRFSDLVDQGIVTNRMALHRLQKLVEDPFPGTVKLGPNTAAWAKDEVDGWCDRRDDQARRPASAGGLAR